MWSCTRSSRGTARCCWSAAPSGFPRAGSGDCPGASSTGTRRLAEGVLRELREETGWEGEVVALLRVNSRPDRPHERRQNVAFDFLVAPRRVVGEPDDESSDVAWIPIADLPPLETLAFDHGETVAWYLRHRDNTLPPPVVI